MLVTVVIVVIVVTVEFVEFVAGFLMIAVFNVTENVVTVVISLIDAIVVTK